MGNSRISGKYREPILASGLEQNSLTSWLDSIDSFKLPGEAGAERLESDAGTAGGLIQQGWDFCSRLPVKSKRSLKERTAGESVVELIRIVARQFCQPHRKAIYQKLTNDFSQFLRVDEIAEKSAELWPGIMPSRKDLAQEAERMQLDKDGLELLQGIFFSQLLSEPEAGIHMLQAMLRPKPESLERLKAFQQDGVLQLDHARLENRDGVAFIDLINTRYLNAEDDASIIDHETAIDLALLHPEIKMGVLRGSVVDHPRYKGRRVFDSGINLTKIYHGKLSFLFYLNRDWGMINKLYYGIAGNAPWEECKPENTSEIPWIAAVESFAIGGGCQTLLVVDYVIAESGSYFNLPARKEGIIPGAANLRLARFLGERMARQAIMFDKTFYVESPEAAGLINEVVPREQMDQVIQRTVDNALGSGMVSAAGNRKALRVQQESLDSFRRYMTTYVEIQSQCHLSGQLIHNLEKHWNAKEKKL
ncbi:MAG: enoyl-CoA hydratase/isomerase family protein [SAR324 cluster bacterium]|nr:enoyl-CoA hydratase/isomerase family protein [SAR324 cluster bacterium]